MFNFFYFLFLIFKKLQLHPEIFKNSSYHFSMVKKFAYMPNKTSISYVKKTGETTLLVPKVYLQSIISPSSLNWALLVSQVLKNKHD